MGNELMNAKNEPYKLHIKNISLLPAFYMLPPEFVMGGCDFKESRDGYTRRYRNMPRNIYEVIEDEKWRAEVEDDAFGVYVFDALSYLLWPVFDEGDRLNTFSDDYPLWRLIYIAAGQSIAELKTYGFTNENLLRFPRGQYVDYFPFEAIQGLMLGIGVTLIQHNDWQPVIDCIKENRCFEDFNGKKSKDYVSFYRSWYAGRKCYDFSEDIEHDIERCCFRANPIDNWITREDFRRYLKQASCQDVELIKLLLRREQLGGQAGIAKELGMQTHSAVSKRRKELNVRFSEWFLLQPPEERKAERIRHEKAAKLRREERKRKAKEEREKKRLSNGAEGEIQLSDNMVIKANAESSDNLK